MAEKRSGSSLASLSGRQSVWTLPTVTRAHVPTLVSSALSTEQDSPVAPAILSAAWSSSSPLWARTRTRPPRWATRSATLAKTTVLPQPVAMTTSVRRRPSPHSRKTASTASAW